MPLTGAGVESLWPLPLVGGLTAAQAIGGFYAASLALVANAVALLVYGSELALILASRQYTGPDLPATTSNQGLVLVVLSACATCGVTLILRRAATWSRVS